MNKRFEGLDISESALILRQLKECLDDRVGDKSVFIEGALSLEGKRIPASEFILEALHRSLRFMPRGHEFLDDAEASDWAKKQISGAVFELLVVEEFSKEFNKPNSNEKKFSKPNTEESERMKEISDILVAIIKDPTSYGLDARLEKGRIPDAVILGFDKQEGVQIVHLVEATTARIDERKLSQLGAQSEGSRATVSAIVSELNKLLAAKQIPPALEELKEKLRGQKLTASKDMGMTLIMTQRLDEGQRERVANKGTINSPLNITDIKKLVDFSEDKETRQGRLIQLLEKYNVNIAFSSFTGHEVGSMADTLLPVIWEYIRPSLRIRQTNTTEQTSQLYEEEQPDKESAQAIVQRQLQHLIELNNREPNFDKLKTWIIGNMERQKLDMGKEIQLAGSKGRAHPITGIVYQDKSDFETELNSLIKSWKIILDQNPDKPTSQDARTHLASEILRILQELYEDLKEQTEYIESIG